MIKFLKQSTVLKGRLTIQKAELKDSAGKKFSKLRVKRQDASCVLVHNTSTNKVILTRQFRYPIYDKVKEPIIEIVAGKVDKGETPLHAAVREVEEEIGYRVMPQNITHLISCYVSPGYTSEMFHIYYATVSNTDKITDGGGIAGEHEEIEITEIQIDEFRHCIRDGLIQDAKTIIAAQLMPKEGGSPFIL